MSDLPVPRRVERMLEAFGADTDFRDAVIGDLAEEFAIRAEADGVGAARRWYFRESLRVAPYLVRDWWRGLTPRDAWYFTTVVGISSITLHVFGGVTRLAMYSIDLGLRSTWEAFASLGEVGPFLFVALMLGWKFLDGVVGGYVAGRLGRRAPLTSALALGAAWLAVQALIMLNSSGIPLLFRGLYAVPLCAGIVAGGILCATRATPRAATLAPESAPADS